MLGPKTTCRLQKPTATADGSGGQTTTWEDVQTIRGVLSSLKASERLAADKITVYATHRLSFDYKAIGAANRAEVNEKNRIVIGARSLDIKGVTNYHDRHYEIDLLESS